MGDSDTTDLERTVSSLLFFSFGFDLSDLRNAESDSTIIDCLIKKAYVDATNQGAFNAQAKKQEDEKRSNAKIKGEVILKKQISNLKEDTDFDEWHKSLCRALVEAYEEDFAERFTYGNAQKWINMTLKYADMLCPLYSHLPIEMPLWMDAIAKHHANLHLPVDSYIIEAVWKCCDGLKRSEPQKNELLPLAIEELERGGWGKYSPDKVKSWSKWNEGDYLKFREQLRLILEETPIEWEAEAWINIAKQRKRD